MGSNYPAHEGLQVDQAANAPQLDTAHGQAAPEVYGQYDTTPELAPAGYVSEPKQETHENIQQAATRRWCGLRRRTALIIAVVAVVVIGAVVGGTVGGLEARNADSNSSETATPTTTGNSSSTRRPTTTSSTALPTNSQGILSLNCPAINNTQYTSNGESFFIYCLMDFTSSSRNIKQSLQTSINDCIDFCSNYNKNNGDPQCQGLTFGANLTQFKNVNCFLKTNISDKVPYDGDNQAGAVLIG